jgi:hypothetical protein
MSNKIALAKFATRIATGFSVAKVVNDMIRNNTTVESTTDNVMVFIGSAVIGSVVSDVTSPHVDAKFDAAVEWLESFNTTENNEYKSNR